MTGTFQGKLEKLKHSLVLPNIKYNSAIVQISYSPQKGYLLSHSKSVEFLMDLFVMLKKKSFSTPFLGPG